MKALLVAVNAKYIHTSLSVRTLKAYANSDNVEKGFAGNKDYFRRSGGQF